MQPTGDLPDLPGLSETSRTFLQQQIEAASRRLHEPQFNDIIDRIAALQTAPQTVAIKDGTIHFQGQHLSAESANRAHKLARELIRLGKGPIPLFDLVPAA